MYDYGDKLSYPLLLIAVIMTPLQGFPNTFVYFAPKFRKMMRDHPERNLFAWLRNTLARAPPTSDEMSVQ